METNNILIKALAQQSVDDADTAACIMDKFPEDMCEERKSWSELCDMAYDLAAGFTTLRNAVKAFLAAPLRNCDMPYNDRMEMYGAFKDWCNAKGHTMEPKLAYDAFEWLLALATEKEGGNDGK